MDFEVMFREATFTNLSLGFASDFDPSIELTVLKAQIGKGWGSVAWGQEPWGGVAAIPTVARTYVPRNKARCHWIIPTITHSEALSNFAITGINFFYNYVSSRVK
jgi:hypothetical protein